MDRFYSVTVKTLNNSWFEGTLLVEAALNAWTLLLEEFIVSFVSFMSLKVFTEWKLFRVSGHAHLRSIYHWVFLSLFSWYCFKFDFRLLNERWIKFFFHFWTLMKFSAKRSRFHFAETLGCSFLQAPIFIMLRGRHTIRWKNRAQHLNKNLFFFHSWVFQRSWHCRAKVSWRFYVMIKVRVLRGFFETYLNWISEKSIIFFRLFFLGRTVSNFHFGYFRCLSAFKCLSV